MPSLVEIVDHESLGRVLRFNLSEKFDRALVTREEVPPDVVLTAELAIERPVTGPTADNNKLLRPWVGIVARMQDVRHYYFLCLQYPDQLVLYRREDDLWVVLAFQQFPVNCMELHKLRLVLRGDRLEGWADGQKVFAVTDYHYRAGKAGIRASCTSLVRSFQVRASKEAFDSFRAALASRKRDEEQLSAALPTPVLLYKFDLTHLGNVFSVQFGNFAQAGKPLQMLVSLGGSSNGTTHVLLSLEGELIWRARLPGLKKCIATEPTEDGHRNLFGVTEDEVLLVDGVSGTVNARRPLPTLPGRGKVPWLFLPTSPVNLSGGSQAREYLIREGDNDGQNVWALDEDLNIIWHIEVPVNFGHDWSLGFCDVDGDGREEVLAGATLICPEGKIIWSQTELNKMLACPGGGHVDAVAIGFFGGPVSGPTAHLQAGSVGNVVLDAVTGQIIAVHPQGHAQGRYVGKFFPNEPGLQVLVGCRWDNYGLLSFYSWDGRRLFTFQPNYSSDCGVALNWTGEGLEFVVVATDPYYAAAWDYQGRRVLDLTPLLPGLGDYRSLRQCICEDILGDPRDEICLRCANVVHIISQEDNLPAGTSVYAPVRRSNISFPRWVVA